MPDGLSVAYANRTLRAIGHPWIQLHVGRPGPLGLDHPARESRRLRCTFTEPVGGAVASLETLVWEKVAANEWYTHFTAWSDDGGFIFPGVVSAEPMYAGDTALLEPGALTAAFDVAR